MLLLKAEHAVSMPLTVAQIDDLRDERGISDSPIHTAWLENTIG